jgi:hypothetical protein
MACLHFIRRYDAKEELPTTYNIAAYVYQVKPDKRGNRWINDAQHVAIKRALEGLQRMGKVIGFRTQRARDPMRDGRTELCHHWMTEQRANEWLAQERRHMRDAVHPEYFAERIDRVTQKMRAIGMKPSK